MLSPPFAFRYNYTFKPVSVNLCKAFSELKKKYSEQPLPIILDLTVDYLALAECFCLFRLLKRLNKSEIHKVFTIEMLTKSAVSCIV